MNSHAFEIADVMEEKRRADLDAMRDRVVEAQKTQDAALRADRNLRSGHLARCDRNAMTEEPGSGIFFWALIGFVVMVAGFALATLIEFAEKLAVVL
ncbi:hypothetical protein [Pseudooceanicola atlanticus]|uniref:hypothetical protein n=1 Tax=Pseudooceanicola atlanticus TaxID=1461694 RepID=UPI0023554003|nr:hypothetical protein [Pseudooceanicola atlanticus]